MVKVRFLSTLKEAAGREWASFRAEEVPDLRSLFARIEAVLGSGALGRSAEFQWRHASAEPMVLINGRQVDRSRWAKTALSEGDEVWLLPPLAGG